MEPLLLLLTNDWDKQNGTMELCQNETWIGFVQFNDKSHVLNDSIKDLDSLFSVCNQSACKIVGAGVATSQWDKMKVPMKKNVYIYIYIYWYIYILFFVMDHFFASNTTFRRGQGTLLLNDLVPHPTAQIVVPLKMKRNVIFFAQFHQFQNSVLNK